MITISAPAKVNLTLEVLGKRADGYHEIASVMQTISLADELSFQPSDRVEFSCRDCEVDRIDLLEESVLKAASLLRKASACRKGARIALEKLMVPRAAGLGSSASLPAGVLRGLCDLWELKLSADRLIDLAAGIGSDAPFFVRRGTALVAGRGEKVSPLPSPALTWLVLLQPKIAVIPAKTARMYGMLKTSYFTDGAATRNLASQLKREDAVLQSDMLVNVFEQVSFDLLPGLDEYRRKMLEAGAERVHLAGAGPALFALAPDRVRGEAIAGKLISEGMEAYLVHTVGQSDAK